MRPDAHLPRWAVVAWLLPALLLSAIPLPGWLAMLWPDWLLLLLIGFAFHSPKSCGPVTAFGAGLALDAFRGILLGQHAFAFVLVVWLVHRFRLRARMFTPLHQSALVLALLWVYQFLLFWIDGLSGHPLTHWARWIPVFTGALSWHWVSAWVDNRLVHR